MLLVTAGVGAAIPIGAFLLRSASTWVGSMAVLATAMALAAALCMAINRQGSKRAFWAGFAIFGSTYLMIAGDPWTLPYDYELFTTTLSDGAYERFFAPETVENVYDVSEPAMNPPALNELIIEETRAMVSTEYEDFIMVAHMLWTYVFAIAGGWISLFMYATGRDRAGGAGAPPAKSPD
jgi:hypothetical protein